MHDVELLDLSTYVMAMTGILRIPFRRGNAAVKMAVSSGFTSATERRCSAAVVLQDVTQQVLFSALHRETSQDFCSLGFVVTVLDFIR